MSPPLPPPRLFETHVFLVTVSLACNRQPCAFSNSPFRLRRIVRTAALQYAWHGAAVVVMQIALDGPCGDKADAAQRVRSETWTVSVICHQGGGMGVGSVNMSALF